MKKIRGELYEMNVMVTDSGAQRTPSDPAAERYPPLESRTSSTNPKPTRNDENKMGVDKEKMMKSLWGRFLPHKRRRLGQTCRSQRVAPQGEAENADFQSTLRSSRDGGL